MSLDPKVFLVWKTESSQSASHRFVIPIKNHFRVKSQTLQARQQYKKLYSFQTLPKLNTKFLKTEVLRTLSQYFIQIAHPSVDPAQLLIQFQNFPLFANTYSKSFQVNLLLLLENEISDCLDVKPHFPIFFSINLSLKKSLDPKFWNYRLTKILKWFRSKIETTLFPSSILASRWPTSFCEGWQDESKH